MLRKRLKNLTPTPKHQSHAWAAAAFASNTACASVVTSGRERRGSGAEVVAVDKKTIEAKGPLWQPCYLLVMFHQIVQGENLEHAQTTD